MPGGFSPWHILIAVIVIAVLFGGKGKLSSFMGDAAKGVKAFKDGLKDDPAEAKEAKGETLPRTDKEKEQLNS